MSIGYLDPQNMYVSTCTTILWCPKKRQHPVDKEKNAHEWRFSFSQNHVRNIWMGRQVPTETGFRLGLTVQQ